MMPEMNGLELSEKLRELENHSDTPIIMISANGQALDQVTSQSSPNLFVLKKPLNQVNFTQLISETAKPSQDD